MAVLVPLIADYTYSIAGHSQNLTMPENNKPAVFSKSTIYVDAPKLIVGIGADCSSSFDPHLGGVDAEASRGLLVRNREETSLKEPRCAD